MAAVGLLSRLFPGNRSSGFQEDPAGKSRGTAGAPQLFWGRNTWNQNKNREKLGKGFGGGSGRFFCLKGSKSRCVLSGVWGPAGLIPLNPHILELGVWKFKNYSNSPILFSCEGEETHEGSGEKTPTPRFIITGILRRF